MKILSIYISLFISLIISIAPNCIHAEDKGGKKLLVPGKDENGKYQWGDFKYLGAFRVPKEDMGGPLYQGLSFGGQVIAYNPANKSLFIVGHAYNQQTAEIKIPDILECKDPEIGVLDEIKDPGIEVLEVVKCKNPGGYTIDKLTTATVLQNLADITNGYRNKITVDKEKNIENGGMMGGLLPWKYKLTDENWLIGSVFAYYDGGYEAIKSHFATSTKLSSSSPQFSGMLELGTKPSPVPQAGFIGGYMAPIPDNWQEALGGKALSGASGLAIITRSSLGPAAFSFEPDELVEKKSPAKATALLYYDHEHPTLGGYGTPGTAESTGRLYNMGSFQTGVNFPAGTRSIIFTGQFGLGEACYGIGTKSKEEANKPGYCYDLTNQDNGFHAYPYVKYAWAYDASDLEEVFKGKKKPWEIVPYAHGEIKLPFVDSTSGFQGASTYDEESKRLYVAQLGADGSWPIIHVFKINIDSQTNPTPAPKIKDINLIQ